MTGGGRYSLSALPVVRIIIELTDLAWLNTIRRLLYEQSYFARI